MTGLDERTPVLPWPLRPPRRVAGIPAGLLVCWQVALLLSLAAIGRPAGHVVGLGVAAAAVITASGVRPNGRWAHEWVLLALRYLVRQQRGSGSPPPAPELAVLALALGAGRTAPDITDVDIEGHQAAMISHAHGCTVVLELDAGNRPGAVALLPLAVAPLHDPDGPGVTVQLLAHATPGTTVRTWLAVQVRREAGYTAEELCGALVSAVRRLWRRLRPDGLVARPLDQAELVAALHTLTRLDLAGPPPPGMDDAAGTEQWRTWWTRTAPQESMVVRAWPDLPAAPSTALLDTLLQPLCPQTVSVSARRLRLPTTFGAIRAGDEVLTVELAVRLAGHDAASLDASTRQIQDRLAAVGASVERLDGRQLPGLAATLPVGGFLAGYGPAAGAYPPPPGKPYPAAPDQPATPAPVQPAPVPVPAPPPVPAPADPPAPAHAPAHAPAASVPAPANPPVHLATTHASLPPQSQIPAAGGKVPPITEEPAVPPAGAPAATQPPGPIEVRPLSPDGGRSGTLAPAPEAASSQLPLVAPAPAPTHSRARATAPAPSPARGRAPIPAAPGPPPPIPAAPGPPPPVPDRSPAPVAAGPLANPRGQAPVPTPPAPQYPQPATNEPATGPLASKEPTVDPTAEVPAAEPDGSTPATSDGRNVAPAGGHDDAVRSYGASLFTADSPRRAELEQQAAAVRASRPPPQVVSVVAGKPGLGSSTTAAGLARTLATLHDAFTALLGGATGRADLAMVQQAREGHTFTVVDLGATVDETTPRVIAASTRILVVTGADRRAASATQLTLERIHQVNPGLAAGAVIAVVCRTRRQYRRVAAELTVDHSPHATRIVPIPYDPALRATGQVNLAQLGPATREAYLRLAATLVSPVSGAPAAAVAESPNTPVPADNATLNH